MNRRKLNLFIKLTFEAIGILKNIDSMDGIAIIIPISVFEAPIFIKYNGNIGAIRCIVNQNSEAPNIIANKVVFIICLYHIFTVL